ncbi:MAG: hypothetical protein M3121_02940 [Chloroflexota bacterium]|nr:hypothetical protein [Chloroflexota bacterium]
MSYPYPQDRHRDRQEKGKQPYEDARHALNQNEMAVPGQGEGGESPAEPLTEEGLSEELQEIAEDRMRQVNDEIVRERQQGPDD